MEKKVNIELSKGLCQQLAKDLVKEEAALLKHEAAIKNIKQLIVEKKKEVIKEYTDYCHYNVQGMESELVYFKLYTGYYNDEYLFVEAYIAALPDSIPADIVMTHAEARLIEKYKEAFNVYHEDRTEENGRKIIELAYSLFRLKHKIDLIHKSRKTIEFDEIANTEFFDRTDIKIRDRYGYEVQIEDYKYY